MNTRIATVALFLVATGSSLRAASSDWNDLKVLKPGQLIGVEVKDGKSYDGQFQALSNDGITMRESATERTLSREDVQRVYLKDKNHRLRNILIGVGIGVGLAALAVKANHTGENTGIRSIGWVWPTGIGTFGGIGAAIPTGGWLLIYRAHRRH